MNAALAAGLRCAVLQPALAYETTIANIALFLTAISTYWIAAAVALLFVALRPRPGFLNALLIAAISWLALRAIGAILRLLIPCISPDAESSFGFVVAVSLSYFLPLRLWQRIVVLAIVGSMAATRSVALGCAIPGELALAVGLVALGVGLLRLVTIWPVTRRIWQRMALLIDNRAARAARAPLTGPVRAVLAAQLYRHLGFTVEHLEPLDAEGVHASTPLILSGRDRQGHERRYFVKIVSKTNWQTSTLYQVLRSLRLRSRIRSGPIWPSLKALVEYEHYMMLLFSRMGIPVPEPHGVYRLQRRAYALVSGYLEGAQSLRGLGTVPERIVEQAFWALRRMSDADLAHRDIKASNLVVLPGDRLAITDLALAEYIAGRRRLAKDLADMIVCLATHHDPERVVALAEEAMGLRALRDARRYLQKTLVNTETQRMLPDGLLPELRALVDLRVREGRAR